MKTTITASTTMTTTTTNNKKIGSQYLAKYIRNVQQANKGTEEIDARIGAFEHKYPDVVDPNHKREETDEQKEIRFRQLRQARKQEMKNRERRHYWWDCHKDEVHCHYFPRDYPTDEEVDWYKSILDKQRNGEFKGYIYSIHLTL